MSCLHGRAAARLASSPLERIRLLKSAYGGYVGVRTTCQPPAEYRLTVADRRITWPDVGFTAVLLVFGLLGT
jgi:hypothetical protein